MRHYLVMIMLLLFLAIYLINIGIKVFYLKLIYHTYLVQELYQLIIILQLAHKSLGKDGMYTANYIEDYKFSPI